MFLEMSRDELHGGGAWGFTKCVWAPTIKKDRAGRWPFWDKILDIRAGDTVLHLRGISPEAFFVGYSVASTDGFETAERPPEPGSWSYSPSFYRADLVDFTPFQQPINLSDVFQNRRKALELYFAENKARKGGKRNVFYVRQSGRLQCQNGAYLSDFDEHLFDALFGLRLDDPVSSPESREPAVSVETGSQLSTVRRRLGQSAFSRSVRDVYGNACCFPSCGISDPRFLVGSHIARWTDDESLRGNVGNGLCLCLVHDKAFETGMFTLSGDFRVVINPKELVTSPLLTAMRAQHGKQIVLGRVAPLNEALVQHWARIKFTPRLT